MDLPFSPSFFKRLEVYQELKDFEDEGKLTWEYEKKVLIYASSAKAIRIGQPISSGDISLVIFNNTDKDNDALDVIRSLEIRGFGELTNPYPYGSSDRIRLNSKGYMAGRVLKETQSLKKAGWYWFWIKMWYAVICVAFFLLILQVANSFKSLLQN
jgi:hypothetical protein